MVYIGEIVAGGGVSTVQHAVSSVQCPGAVLEIMESRARSDTEQYEQDTAASPDLAPDQQ